jgi:predicted nucleic acid-binding Zn ribbon protein
MSVEEDDGLEDSDGPGEGDLGDSEDGAEFEECPYCGKSVVEGAEVCPHCGNYFSREDSRAGTPMWIVVGGIVTLVVIVVVWVLRG